MSLTSTCCCRGNDTREIIVDTFSLSSYLTRLLLSLENLEGIFEYPDIRMDYRSLKERFVNLLTHARDPLNAVKGIQDN